jgi:hypothetical protein
MTMLPTTASHPAHSLCHQQPPRDRDGGLRDQKDMGRLNVADHADAEIAAVTTLGPAPRFAATACQSPAPRWWQLIC